MRAGLDVTISTRTLVRIGITGAGLAVMLALAGCGSPDPEVEVALSDSAFEPATIPVERGKKTVLVLRNTGTVEHNLALQRQAVASPLVKPGETVRFEVALQQGNHAIICSVPGHQEAGKVGQITATRSR